MTANRPAPVDAGSAAAPVQPDWLQVIGLRLGDERFIVDIHYVREIVRATDLEITRVPHSHGYVLGVVNLRGKVVPVIDLARRLGMAAAAAGHQRRLIVAEFDDRRVGFTVEAVSEVLRLPAAAIAEPDAAERADYVLGVVMVNGQIMCRLDLAGLATGVDKAGRGRGEGGTP
jgi:purine-binding chemotaxis protein CheW